MTTYALAPNLTDRWTRKRDTEATERAKAALIEQLGAILAAVEAGHVAQVDNEIDTLTLRYQRWAAAGAGCEGAVG